MNKHVDNFISDANWYNINSSPKSGFFKNLHGCSQDGRTLLLRGRHYQAFTQLSCSNDFSMSYNLIISVMIKILPMNKGLMAVYHKRQLEFSIYKDKNVETYKTLMQNRLTEIPVLDRINPQVSNFCRLLYS